MTDEVWTNRTSGYNQTESRKLGIETTEMDGTWGCNMASGLAVLTSTAQNTVPSWAAGVWGLLFDFPSMLVLGLFQGFNYHEITYILEQTWGYWKVPPQLCLLVYVDPSNKFYVCIYIYHCWPIQQVIYIYISYIHLYISNIIQWSAWLWAKLAIINQLLSTVNPFFHYV